MLLSLIQKIFLNHAISVPVGDTVSNYISAFRTQFISNSEKAKQWKHVKTL